MSLSVQLQNLAIRIGTEVKALRTLLNGNAADNSALLTTAKANLVAAINEVKADLDTLATSPGGATINDAATSTGSVWSSAKTAEEITTASTQDRDRANHTGTQALATVSGLPEALDAKAAQADLSAHANATNNPHAVTKAQVGLGNVDNTADADKPVSTAVATALAGKSNTGHTHATTEITGFDAAVLALADERIEALIDGAPEALDTLRELAAALGDDPNFAGSISDALGKRVRFDAPQTLTAGEATQARSNIGAASASALSALTTAVGETEYDFVQTFQSALL